jgi:DNA-binding beta-propeller fold protein YncE
MNYPQKISLSVLLCATLAGCKDGFWTKDRYDPSCPQVESVAPLAAPAGALVTITGAGFEANLPALYEVLIGNETVDSLQVLNGSTMTFRVPKGIGSGALTVRLAGSGSCEAALKPTFTYLLTATNVSRFAGNFGQPGAASCPSCLNTPNGIKVDGAGNVWVADKGNHVVRQISPSGGLNTIGSFGQPGCENTEVPSGTNPRFNWPIDIGISANGDVFIAEESSFTIRRRVSAGNVFPFAGKCSDSDFIDGNCNVARLATPYRIAQDGNVTYIADSGKIRKADGSANVTCPALSTLVESGSGGLSYAFGIEVSRAIPNLGPIFVTDIGTGKIKAVTQAGVVSDIATTGETFNEPRALAIDSQGNIFVADEARNQILVVYPGGRVAVLAGTGIEGISDNVPGLVAQFKAPLGIAVDPKNDKILYVSDSKNHVVRKITLE